MGLRKLNICSSNILRMALWVSLYVCFFLLSDKKLFVWCYMVNLNIRASRRESVNSCLKRYFRLSCSKGLASDVDNQWQSQENIFLSLQTPQDVLSAALPITASVSVWYCRGWLKNKTPKGYYFLKSWTSSKAAWNWSCPIQKASTWQLHLHCTLQHSLPC